MARTTKRTARGYDYDCGITGCFHASKADARRCYDRTVADVPARPRITLFDLEYFTPPAVLDRGLVCVPTPGTVFDVSVAAPGIGATTYRVIGTTDAGKVRCRLVKSSVREMEPWEAM